MTTIKARIEKLEKNTERPEMEVIIMDVDGFPRDEYRLTVGRDEETLTRQPDESEEAFVARCESLALSRFKLGGPVPVLLQKPPRSAVSPKTGLPVEITLG